MFKLSKMLLLNLWRKKMNRILNFSKRNLKEVLRDPIIYVFCIGFPVIMLALFQIINKYTAGNTPMFELKALLPAIIMFSYTFVMLTMALLVSKDRQTSFLKRLYSSPMKPCDFILGYSFVGIIVGIVQTIVCIVSAFIISLITNAPFISFSQTMLLIVSQLPILLTCVFLGILFGSLLSDKGAPGVCSVFISLAGMLGGCWMPLETMGNFEVFCRWLPFYPSVYLGKVVTQAVSSLGITYAFDNIAKLGLLPIMLYMVLSIVLSIVVFRKNMINDK